MHKPEDKHFAKAGFKPKYTFSPLTNCLIEHPLGVPSMNTEGMPQSENTFSCGFVEVGKFVCEIKSAWLFQ